jgi:predicted SprT family Zn-dependent metalloprotease
MRIDKAIKLAGELMDEHGLRGRAALEIDDVRTRFGQWYEDRKVISISRPFIEVNKKAKVREVILHEIAHALVGGEHGHNKIWKAKAAELGVPPVAKVYGAVLPESRYIGSCACGYKHEKHKLDLKSDYICRECRRLGLPMGITWIDRDLSTRRDER